MRKKGSLETRLDRMEARLDAGFDEIRKALLDIQKNLSGISERLARVETMVKSSGNVPRNTLTVGLVKNSFGFRRESPFFCPVR